MRKGNVWEQQCLLSPVPGREGEISGFDSSELEAASFPYTLQG